MNTFEPMASRVRSSGESAHTGEREISMLVQPEVALHQSRVGNTWRQFNRRIVRSLYVVTGDAIAIAVVSAAVSAVARAVGLRAGTAIPTLDVGQVIVAMLVCLALTGNYQRSSPSQLHFRLLTGASFGAIVVYWPSVWSAHALLAIPLAAVLSLTASAALVAMRLGSDALVSRLVPEDRRLAPAIVLTADAGTEAVLPVAAGYRVAGSMVLDCGTRMPA